MIELKHKRDAFFSVLYSARTQKRSRVEGVGEGKGNGNKQEEHRSEVLKYVTIRQ